MKKKIEIQVFDTPIPSTEALERDVLADAIVSPELLGDTIQVVNPDFFTSDERREIWETIVDRYNKGEEIGLSMASTLPAIVTEVLPHIDGAGMSETPYRAMLLRDGAARRRAYFAAAEFIATTVNPTVSEQDLITSVEGFARSIEGPAPLQAERSLASVIEDVRKNVERTAQLAAEGKQFRVTTGYEYMDNVLNGGMKPGQLVVIAARPSVGKTALMLQMAKAASMTGQPVQVFSLEMQAEELAERMLYSTELVFPHEVNYGRVDRNAFARAEAQIAGLPFYINDFSRSLDEIVSRMTQAVKKGRCKVAYIDYLGLMQDALNFGNAKLYQVIARITGTLKAVAKRLEIPIVLLCQLNRDQARENRPPQLFDLRDSGSIEQDADVVLMLESKVVSEGRLYVWLRKNRGGQKEWKFVFSPNETYSSFTELNPIPPGDVALPAPAADDLPEGDNPTEEEDDDLLPF